MFTPPFALWVMDGPGENILLAMFLVFVSAKLLAEIFEGMNQPGIVGEMLAGIVIGPSLLNWVQPTHLLKALADLGVMFLLFRAGLEVKSGELAGVGKTALKVALLGVVIPFPVGWLMMSYWGAPDIEAIFVGSAMVATSVGITARVLASMGLLEEKASKTILAAAVIDDVLGLIVLAIVSSLAKGAINVVGLLFTSAAAIGFTVAVAVWGKRGITHLFPRLERRLRTGEIQFNLAMIVLFGLALLATYAGVAAIIGAFLAGMALSDALGRRVHVLTVGVAELLTPFFLAEIGLHLDVSVFARTDTLLLCAAVTVAAIVSKLAGCGLGAWTMGWRNALRVGAGMAPRGEVGMVVAQIGLGLGVIRERTYAVIVFMAIATTMAAPAILKLVFRGLPGRPESTTMVATNGNLV